LKVFQLISSAGHYGAEAMLLNLSRSLVDVGCEVTLGIFHNEHAPNLDVASRAAAYGLHTEILECRGRVDIGSVRALRSLLRSKRPDVLHLHGYKADIYGALAAHGRNIPTVATCHNWLSGTPALNVYNRLDLLALRSCDRLAAVSDSVASVLRTSGIPAQKVAVIPNGIDIAPFESAAPAIDFPGRLTLGMVARLDMNKGFGPLLHALVEVARHCPEILLIVAGEGPARNEIEESIANLQLQNNVRLLGTRKDMPELYASFNVFVLPSLNEGMPLTVLEAFASGLPVVATGIGAIPSVVQDGVSGILVDPGDVASLAAAILKLAREPELRARMGAAGGQKVRAEYTASSMAHRYLELYRSAGSESQPGVLQAASPQ
jgi:glycosyltransferase involved in cell wall biosynthesis